MKWIISALGIASALVAGELFTSIGQGQPQANQPNATPKSPRTLTASGIGTIKVNADSATIIFKIDSPGNDLKPSRDLLEKQAARLKHALNGLKIPLEFRQLPVEISVQQNLAFNGGFLGGPLGPAPAQSGPMGAAPASDKSPLAPDQKGGPKPEPSPKDFPFGPSGTLPGGGFSLPQWGAGFGMNYQLTQSFVATIRNSDSIRLHEGVDKILFTAAELGIYVGNDMAAIAHPGGTGPAVGSQTALNGPRVTFHCQNEREARRKALQSAVADAMENAKVMAKGADVKIVEPLSIVETPESRTDRPLAEGGSGQSGTIDNVTGEMEIIVRVTVVCSF